MQISQLWIYPVKSMGGTRVTACELSDRGFVDDRRYMAVDRTGKFMSQRKHPRMALIDTEVHPDALVLQAPGMNPLTLRRRPTSAAVRPVRVWEDACHVQNMGPEASKWLGDFLQVECDLVYMPDGTHRAVSAAHGRPGDIVSLADGFPLLLTNEASLTELNTRLETPVDMSRFRANIVVDGAAPWAEDHWQRLDIGSVSMRVVKPCGRCVIINTDQTTAEVGKEPLRTLASYRRQGKSVIFGQNLVHDGYGILRVGDAVNSG